MKTHVRKYIELALLLLFGAMIALAQPDLTPITIYTPKHTFVEWAYTRPEEWSQQDKQGQALYYLSIYKTAMVLLNNGRQIEPGTGAQCQPEQHREL